jgi:hypothetical protein
MGNCLFLLPCTVSHVVRNLKAKLNAHNCIVYGGVNPNTPNATIVSQKNAQAVTTVIQQNRASRLVETNGISW